MELTGVVRHNLVTGLLHGLDEQQIKDFLADCMPREFPQAKDILQQGLTTDSVYIIQRGQVEVSYVDREGNAFVIHLASPGEVLGEVEALSARPCAATCKALPGAGLLVCAPSVLLRHVPAAQLVGNLAGLLHDRLVRDNKQRSVHNFMTADQRIDYYLHRLTSANEPRVSVSQAYLATLAGCTRQTVNVRLNRLRQEGTIDFGRGEIHVLSRDRLRPDGTAA